jgi:hypothetical protein
LPLGGNLKRDSRAGLSPFAFCEKAAGKPNTIVKTHGNRNVFTVTTEKVFSVLKQLS